MNIYDKLYDFFKSLSDNISLWTVMIVAKRRNIKRMR